uniref:Uncharacterized protein n=1 Tax=Eutreptiella gymnastica TaxID=73025 RepID=A0A7S1HUW2_9EUGL|mmetsp:Transcript_106563/g.183729  ORF Transcript_106563/g.183729 Transcript_106563/m.183729 type:complete len:127 (+) Transcript_106563:355-735(+)
MHDWTRMPTHSSNPIASIGGPGLAQVQSENGSNSHDEFMLLASQLSFTEWEHGMAHTCEKPFRRLSRHIPFTSSISPKMNQCPCPKQAFYHPPTPTSCVQAPATSTAVPSTPVVGTGVPSPPEQGP